MSNIKITQLPELAPTPLSGSDVFPVVSSNVTYQVTANAIATFVGGGGANTGNVTFSDITIQGTGDEYGGSGLYLAPGTASTANLQYLRVRGGDYPTHIHLDTGNNAYFDQYFGADSRFVKLEANGNIVINADDYVGNTATWNFGVDGTVILPPTNTAAIEGTDAYDVRIRAVSISDPVSASLENYNGGATTTSVSANPTTVTISADTSTWTFDNTGELAVANLSISASNGIGAQASIVEDNGSLAVLATGTNGLVNIGWSDTTLLGNTAVMWFNEPGNVGNAIIRTGNTAATSYTWAYNNTGGLALATVNSESAQFVGTRKIVSGALTGATSPYAVVLAAGGTPTAAYLASAGVYSTKVTFVTQSNGSAFQWEQFDVVATPSGDVPGAVNFVVSNRVKSTTTVPDTTVTATMNGSQIEITLTLSAAQTGGGWASFDATEFGLMVD